MKRLAGFNICPSKIDYLSTNVRDDLNSNCKRRYIDSALACLQALRCALVIYLREYMVVPTFIFMEHRGNKELSGTLQVTDLAVIFSAAIVKTAKISNFPDMACD